MELRRRCGIGDAQNGGKRRIPGLHLAVNIHHKDRGFHFIEDQLDSASPAFHVRGATRVHC
jgi:hypothetical protein